MCENDYDEELRNLQVNYLEETIDNLGEASARLHRCLEGRSKFDVDETFRTVHSLKGSAGTYGFVDFTDVAMHLESVLARLRDGSLAMSGEVLRFVTLSFEALAEGFVQAQKAFSAKKEFVEGDSGVQDAYFAMAAGFEKIVSACPLPSKFKKDLPEERKPAPRAAGAMRAVLAYNSRIAGKIVADTLAARNIEVFETTSGSEALEKVVSEGCDYLVTFQMLEDINGQALCAAVKLTPALSNVKVIFITSDRNVKFSDYACPDRFFIVDDDLSKNLERCLDF